MAKYTPMMEQYLEIKKNYKYCLLFFRLGDFYELFFEDAVIASKELEITLTGKDCGQAERAPMCGVPFHSADGYIAKLVEKGYKVAICEQVEDPKKTKTLVKRDVVRVITAGTVLDSNILDEGKNNYIMNIYSAKNGFAIAAADVTTGEFIVSEYEPTEENKIIDEIAKFNPAEIIYNCKTHVIDNISNIFALKPSVYSEWAYNYENANKTLCSQFKVLNLNGFGLEGCEKAICCAGALFEYLLETQKNSLSHMSKIKKQSSDKYMILDISSRRNLELTETIRDKTKKGSLLWVLDKTKTSMGARLIRKWIEMPLLNISDIEKRLNSVEALKDDVFEREELKEYLNTIHDIERLMSKIIYATNNARDLASLKNSLVNLPYIKQLLSKYDSQLLSEIYEEFDCLEDIYKLLDESIHNEPPFSVREGGLIKDGYNSDVDMLRKAKNEGSSWLMQLEAEEREKTNIKALKIKYNKVFGYFIEVTNSYLSMVPDRYIRKQTLSNGERFITEELKKIEETILGADEKIVELEYNIFSEIRDKIAGMVERIQKTAYNIARIDVLQSFADVSYKNGYIKPNINNSGDINIKNGRHPVVELISSESFIPNDVKLDISDNRLAIITGPNMAGKSTYMRQCALLVLMSQIGCFIPAESAEIGVCDRIFTRVGASDDLATGQSTFMIEMSEVANILNYATKKSLLILDEIGRGTSTFDGLSIAWAVLEYIADTESVGARTLFATHYHELTELEDTIAGVKNYCISVEEKGDEIIFLRKIIRGGADKSYGIHVAKLAGVPNKILQRADEILNALSESDIVKNSDIKEENEFYYDEKAIKTESFFINEITEFIDKLDMNNLPPIEAWNRLLSLKDKINKIKNLKD